MKILKQIDSFIRRFIFLRQDENINLVMIEEDNPYFADKFFTTNKTILIINKKIKDNYYECFRKNFLSNDYVNRQVKNPLTQNGKTIKLKRNLKKIESLFFFEKNNFLEGQIYGFNDLGYIGNISFLATVFLVTDRYVFFKDTINNVHIYTFDELMRMGSSLVFIE